MKKIKLSFILVIVFICSGCNIKYRINFSDEKISEDIEVSEMNNNFENDLIDPVHYIFQGRPYNILSNENSSRAKQDWLSLNSFFNNSVLFKDYLQENSISIDGKIVSFDLKINDITKRYLDLFGNIGEMEFSIYIPYYVSSHNATSVSNNTYTWKINDIENANIKINFDMSKSYKYKNNAFSIYIIIGLSVIIGGVIIYFVIKNKKANEI